MTTGRINQVRTIGGARVPAGPRPPGSGPQRALARPPGPASRRAPSRWARGLSPVQAASDARARLPTPRRSAPRAGHGAELPMRGGPRGRSLASPRPAPPSASARSRRLQTPGRVSPRLRGARLGPGWGPSSPYGVAPSGARSPAPGLRPPRLDGPPARPHASPLALRGRARGLGPVRVASDAWTRLPAPWGSAPRAGPPRARTRRPPAYAILAWPDRVPASFWFTHSERRRLHASSRSTPLGTVRLRTATRTKACDPSATASVLPLGRPPPTERHLQVMRRPPLASRPGPVSTRRRTGARIRTPHDRPPARAWLRRRAELAPWPPPEALPPCALRADPTRLPHTICYGTMRTCENGGPPPLPFWGGEERRARWPAGRARARGCGWARHT